MILLNYKLQEKSPDIFKLVHSTYIITRVLYQSLLFPFQGKDIESKMEPL